MNPTLKRREITVTIKIFGGLREAFGSGLFSRRLPVGCTVAGLLADFETDLPDPTSKLRDGLRNGYLNVLVNGRNMHFLQGHQTVLHDGDAVAFLPPVGGG